MIIKQKEPEPIIVSKLCKTDLGFELMKELWENDMRKPCRVERKLAIDEKLRRVYLPTLN